jgi:Protein of unknown function (DUF3443)/Bacterial Ig-like domain (group 2)
MKSNNVPLLFLILVLLAGCGLGGSGGGSGGSTVSLVSVAVTPGNPFVAPGATAQFTATGAYSNNTTKDLTTTVTWSSTNPSVATISNEAGSQGAATSISTGITAITAISGGVSGSTSLTVTAAGTGGAANNVLSITVNGALCSAGNSAGYVNKPCVSVTVCTPGSATACQTIDDILLDTGSSGLRIFKQALTNTTVALTSVTSGTGLLAECAQFADGSSDWGPVQLADVLLGNEPAVQVSVHVIDAAFGTVPTLCGIPDPNPAAAGFNGILGVGLFSQDCGSHCATSAIPPPIYFSCKGTACSRTTVPLSDQVTNPVTLLPVDKNGVIVQLPSVPLGGLPSVNGNLILGIGTQANNAPSGTVTAYTTNTVGEIITTLSGASYPRSIIDTGSNGLFFPAPGLPICASPNATWFCPLSSTAFSAVNAAASGSPSSAPISFQIGHFTSLLSSPNAVFSEIGGPTPGLFDWGLPFYFGRDVYVGFEGKASRLGVGPYFAY